MKNWILALALLSFPVMADLVLDIRDDDPGFMEMIPESDVDITKTLNFEGLGNWDTEKDGFSWQAVLQGMETECRITDRNPCLWETEIQCQENNGFKPVNRSFGTPTAPLMSVMTGENGHVINYSNPHLSLTDGSLVNLVSFSRGGCHELGGADWGDGPWAIVFDQPYEAVCFDVRFLNPEIIRRQHFKFWRNNNGVIEKVGHQDLVGEIPEPHENGYTVKTKDKRFCWGSSVPIEAVSTWQDGPGVWWLAVQVGHLGTTECERATRRAAEICEAEEP